ncbi:MAG: Heat-inducible transcription repressor HrcA [Chlamydiales bacterium]|nr:Heat-inducible transcription repressor HrcA [Chlamydiales bacterium]MCH9635544.1 Heat-inducible transcription repressor HrcA [Chlamydiales bacterium]
MRILGGMKKKEKREQAVLMALVELFLESGKPIGSNTLMQERFPSLSSATIRNYFAKFEKLGYLKQPHSSGGRLPTEEGIRLYVENALSSPLLLPGVKTGCKLKMEQKNVHTFLQRSVEKLSELTGLATFLSSARFDHDFIQQLRLVEIDDERILSVLITDFGQVLTEILPAKKLSAFALKRIEAYLMWRIRGGAEPDLHDGERGVAQKLYSEIVVRYMVRYSNFSEEEVFRTGFSRLLNFPEFADPVALSSGLSLFENMSHMRLLLNDCMRENKLCYWVGSDLAPYAAASECSVLAVPYHIGETRVGAIGLLGSSRMPYRELFGTLQYFSESMTKVLTKSLVKFKLSFRQPRAHGKMIDQTSIKLLENK